MVSLLPHGQAEGRGTTRTTHAILCGVDSRGVAHASRLGIVGVSDSWHGQRGHGQRGRLVRWSSGERIERRVHPQCVD